MTFFFLCLCLPLRFDLTWLVHQRSTSEPQQKQTPTHDKNHFISCHALPPQQTFCGTKKKKTTTTTKNKAYSAAVACVFVFKNFIHPVYFVTTTVDHSTTPPTTHREVKMEFLPLMLMSVVCAVGLVVYWLRLFAQHRRKMEALEQYKVRIKRQPARARRRKRSKRIQFATDTESE